MNCEFVKNKIDEYFQNTLSSNDENLFRAHAHECEKCQNLLMNYKKYFDLLKRSEPGFEPPENLLDKISDGLMCEENHSGEEHHFDKKELDNTIKKAIKTSQSELNTKDSEKNYKSKLPKVILAIIILLTMIAASIWFFMIEHNK